MMQYATTITHATASDHDGTRWHRIDGAGLVSCAREFQIRHGEQGAILFIEFGCFLIIESNVFQINFTGFYRHGTVEKNLPRRKIPLLEIASHGVENHLATSDGKSRDQNVASGGRDSTCNVADFGQRVLPVSVFTIAISAFHQHQVCVFKHVKVAKYW